jgi:hypothetical protein
MDRLKKAVLLALAAMLGGCEKKPEGPVCGLHSAAAVVFLEVEDKDNPRRPLAVGAQLMADDRLVATGPALIECYGGAFKFLEKGDKVRVWDLKESRLQGVTYPVHTLTEGKAKKVDEPMQRTIMPRYSSNRFTPASALAGDAQLTTQDYFMAFFSPKGMESLTTTTPNVEGPSKLPPPPNRPKVPTVHAGDQGDGPLLIKVEDEVVFLETDDLATSALLDGRTYMMGRATRLVLPDDAEATLELKGGKKLSIEGPMELRLQNGQEL